MRIEFSPDRSLYPFESRWFDSSAGRVHHVDEGTGAPLLLLHGNPTWSSLYRHNIGALRDRYRCVAPDYLGVGLSEHPDGFGYTIEEHARVVGELLDHLGLDDVVVMGQDWGRSIGCAVAVERADRIRGAGAGQHLVLAGRPAPHHAVQPDHVDWAAAAAEPVRRAPPAGRDGPQADTGGDGPLSQGPAQPGGASP